MLRVVTSTSAAARLAAARAFLQQLPVATETLVIGATRGAADDFVRAIARERGATFGLTRLSLTEFAAHAARAGSTGGRRAPATHAAAEAVAARAVFESAGDLTYFTPVASMPGFSKALARTVHELRLAGIDASALAGRDAATADVGRLLARIEQEFGRAAVDDRAALFRAATAAVAAGQVRWAGCPIVLLDVPLDAAVERDFIAALAARAPSMLATVSEGDHVPAEALSRLGAAVERVEDAADAASDLAHLRRHVFTVERPPRRKRTGDVRLFSAPGEGREAIEIVRRMLDEAQSGVPFDRMAVFLRTPAHYLGLLEHACDRGGVPAYFERGIRRPDPAGRAFIALLSCAVEGLSAKRFDEYLSLGQVPQFDPASRPQPPASVVSPRDEMFGAREDGDEDTPEDIAAAEDDAPDSDDEAVIAGTLRSPWKWEELVVESAVVGGRTRADGGARWRRRLAGLAADYRLRIDALRREEPESARIIRLERDVKNLQHLRQFALPIVDALSAWPEHATWGAWLDRFSTLAGASLGRPARVLETLASLRPMAEVGPVGLEEVRDVLRDRLVMLDRDPPARRYGRVFIGTPHQARGRTFTVVFVPGLAERVVPQRPHEDPLLLDDRRRALDGGLAEQDDRKNAERLLLKLSIGAAEERLYLSYPRLDVAETRARVPSFYALDVIRAITGDIPDHRQLAKESAEEAGASLAWPAPKDPSRAIDDLEHDLASLKPLLESRDPASVRGHAHYLLQLNEALRRSVISRWARGRSAWSQADGLIRVAPAIRTALEKERLANRPYSLSALQRFSACPYQFLLATIYRLEPREEPEPLMRLDPLTRGSLFHEVQAKSYRAMRDAGLLPVSRDRVSEASKILTATLLEVAAGYEERLAPAIERVWRDEIGELRRDLGIWVQKMAPGNDAAAWVPEYFEFSFGLSDEGRDERSLRDPVTIDGRFVLRGSIDLIERSPDGETLRVTDHKTGKNRSNKDLIIGGGAVLQPVLYSAAVEQGLGRKVAAGRLYYCTTAGGFADHAIPINDYTRGQGLQALTIIDRAVEQGFLVAAPADRACTWCNFRPVCGPREEERVKRKAADRIADLKALREMR